MNNRKKVNIIHKINKDNLASTKEVHLQGDDLKTKDSINLITTGWEIIAMFKATDSNLSFPHCLLQLRMRVVQNLQQSI